MGAGASDIHTWCAREAAGASCETEAALQVHWSGGGTRLEVWRSDSLRAAAD